MVKNDLMSVEGKTCCYKLCVNVTLRCAQVTFFSPASLDSLPTSTQLLRTMPREPTQSTRSNRQQNHKRQSYPLMEKTIRHQAIALSRARRIGKQAGQQIVQSVGNLIFHHHLQG
jgi:hypothetical protein